MTLQHNWTRRLLALTSLLLVCVMIFASCNTGSSQATETSIPTETTKPTEESKPTDIVFSETYVISCLNQIPGIIEIQAATEDNDPNGQLNKPRGYISHVYFSYALVNQSELIGDDLISKGTDAGGSIEVYTTKEDAERRNEYLSSLDGTVLSSGSHIVLETCVIRTSDELTATQQSFLENNIISALKEKDFDMKVFNESFGNLNYSQGLEYKLNNDGQSYSLIGIGTCTDKNLNIPDNYNNLPITQIAEDSFRSNKNITSVIIPSSVKVIMYFAFKQCPNLKAVKILNGTTTIAESAFEHCNALEIVYIPESVDYMGPSAFYKCDSIYMVNCDSLYSWCNIYFGNDFSNPTYHSQKLFINGKHLQHFTIPNGITKIHSYAFRNCHSIINIEIPSTVVTIHEDAFIGCTSLTSISFEGTVSEWNAIELFDDWNRTVPATKVICSDGTVYLS